MNNSESDRAKALRQRVDNELRERGEDVQFGLQRYEMERSLYRLGISSHRERFVLKGAALFALWGGSADRPTRDLDFTGSGNSEKSDVLDAMRDICSAACEPAELHFDSESLAAEEIRFDSEYKGLRVKFSGWLGKSRIPMQVDIGFADAIHPAPQDSEYPTLLDDPPARIRTYPREAVVAEKFHAMVLMGIDNSRIKDFFDIHVLAAHFPFNGEHLSNAISATFKRRDTEINGELPVALTSAFYVDDARSTQWHGYLRRNSLSEAPEKFTQVGMSIADFLTPIWHALGQGATFDRAWKPGGPWKAHQ